jgi:PAS domain-containing protein
VADVATGQIVLSNPGAEHLLGYPAAEASGLPREALVPDSLKALQPAGFGSRYETWARPCTQTLASGPWPARPATGGGPSGRSEPRGRSAERC